MIIRKACDKDLSRIAEIFVFNNRVNYLPIFNDTNYSFKELQVVSFINDYLINNINHIYVYDDGIIKGFVQILNQEVVKLYVDVFFQNQGIGDQLIEFAVSTFDLNYLWSLEKNTKAIKFYLKHGFVPNGEKTFEEGTKEYIIKLRKDKE